MGFARVMSRAQAGLAAPLVAVEVHLGSGLPQFNIVGLPAAAVKESRERVRAALATCGFELPAGRITVNLAPADLPKEGGRYDLPIALGILLASAQVQPPCDVDRTEFYGELGLTGELKPVPGLLLAALHAVRAGHSVLVPRSNLAEVRAADAAARALGHLRALVDGEDARDASLADSSVATAAAAAAAPAPVPRTEDLADVRGQHQAKRALLIAAAGGHSLLMIGPPGSGKTMLAQRLPGLLPPLDASQALEIAAIGAVAPASAATSIAARRPPAMPPLRAPHHTASAHAIVGGGSAVQPGEVSLAHHGVLFLDELPEFDRRVLESLREPLESGRVSVVRASQRAEFPASFLLVAAMNPCPCVMAWCSRPADAIRSRSRAIAAASPGRCSIASTCSCACRR
jgi:magnesium chelatase family protein